MLRGESLRRLRTQGDSLSLSVAWVRCRGHANSARVGERLRACRADPQHSDFRTFRRTVRTRVRSGLRARRGHLAGAGWATQWQVMAGGRLGWFTG